MVERLFFSKLVTKDLTAVESNRRLFEGVLTVEMKDRQGEITIRDELLKVLPIWIARGGPITDTHSNRVVGQGINFGSTTITDEEGKSYPAITIQGEIYKDYELDDEIWNAIKSGKYKGLSFGGATKSNRTPIMQKDGSLAYSLKDLEQYEVAVCEEPAVPLALITQHNEIAKAMAGETKDRGDGKMCIRCDKFKCYVEKDSLVKIEDDEDDNTQVTVLDEWKNETHPDKNGKTEGIRTTKGDDSFSDTRGPNTPNEDEDAEALENNRGEPQENGATYHGTSKGRKITYRDPDPTESDPEKIMDNAATAGKQIQSFEKGRTHTCDSDVAEINNVDVGDKPSGMPKVQAMDKDNDEMLEEADLEEIEKKRVTEGDEVEYGFTNEAGEKVNRYGRKMPKVMGRDTRQTGEPEKPKGRATSRNVTGFGESIQEGRQRRGESRTQMGGMSESDLKRRQSGNWNKPKQEAPKVSGKKIKPSPTVTHDKETGMTTIDNSTARRGSFGTTTMPTERYISGIGKALDILNSIMKIKIGPVTSEARRGLIQDTKVPGTMGNQNKLQQESNYINTGKKIKPTGRDTKFTDEDKEALKTDYNTDEVVREYDDSKKKLENKATGEAPYTEPGRGGFAGREEGETCDKNESTSIHNVNQPKHVNEPYDDEEAEGVKKNDRAMAANNAEDGINGKMRLDNDPPAEALEKQEKVYDGKDRPGQVTRPNATTIDADGDYPTEKTKDTGVMDPGSGSGGIRTGASYDNAQQDTGQKDNPRKVKEEEYTGEEDRGSLNEKYSGEEDTVSGTTTAFYNKTTLILNKLNLDLKKQQ
jgi:hypothetical protein